MLLNTESWMDSMYQSLGLFLCFYNIDQDRFQFCPNANLDFYGLLELSGMKEKLQNSHIEFDQPIFISNPINCNWMSIPTSKEKESDVCIVGPTLISSISKKEVIKYYCQQGLSIEEASALFKDYEKMPIIPYAFLLELYEYIYYVLVGEKAKVANLGLLEYGKNELLINKNEKEVYRLQQQDFTVSIEAERFLYDCVRYGKIDWIKNKKPKVIIDVSALGPDPIRSLKNTLIIAIALATRAALEGGLPVETAYPLSDMYIIQIEAISEVSLIVDLYHKAILDFATRVKNNKYSFNYSKRINQCCVYIMTNIDKTLKVSEVAQIFGLHPDTLSKQFKQETGMLITDYIRKTKVKKAKMLLLHTDKSLIEISNILSYSSQSQFIVSFKRVTGATPHEFRTSKN